MRNLRNAAPLNCRFLLGNLVLLSGCLLLLGQSASQNASAAEASVETSQYMMYVSLGGEKKIACYQLDSETGALKRQESLDVDGAPGPMAVGPKRQFLYVAIRSTGSVATMKIDSKSGKLAQVATTPVVANPVYLSLDKTGKFLLTAYYGAGKAAIFP